MPGPFCLAEYSALHIAAVITSSLSYPFGVYEPLFHSPTTGVREKSRREWRAYARTHSSAEPLQGWEWAEEKRERDSLGLRLPSSAHPLPFGEDFNLARTRLLRRQTDRLSSVPFALADAILTEICIIFLLHNRILTFFFLLRVCGYIIEEMSGYRTRSDQFMAVIIFAKSFDT